MPSKDDATDALEMLEVEPQSKEGQQESDEDIEVQSSSGKLTEQEGDEDGDNDSAHRNLRRIAEKRSGFASPFFVVPCLLFLVVSGAFVAQLLPGASSTASSDAAPTNQQDSLTGGQIRMGCNVGSLDCLCTLGCLICLLCLLPPRFLKRPNLFWKFRPLCSFSFELVNLFC